MLEDVEEDGLETPLVPLRNVCLAVALRASMVGYPFDEGVSATLLMTAAGAISFAEGMGVWTAGGLVVSL